MSHKILLIDDSAMLRRVAANILHAQPGGYQVLAATRAAEGFARACAGDVDLILLGHHLAGYASAELCQLLLTEARTAQVPTILLVSQGMPAPALDTLPINVIDTLTKPIAPEQLSGLVNAVFSFARAHLSLREIRTSLHPDLRDRQLDGDPVETQGGSPERIGRRPTPPALTADDEGSLSEGPGTVPSQDRAPVGGSTDNVPLRTVVRSISAEHQTGTLRLSLPDKAPTEVIFDDGRIVAVSTRDGRTYAAGAMGYMPAKVSAATVEAAVAEQNETGVPFLLTLGTGGLLSKASAVSLLHHFGQRQFARFWGRQSGSVEFEFEPLEALPGFTLRLEPSGEPVDAWLWESTRQLRFDDVVTGLRHEGLVGVPSSCKAATETLAALNLSGPEKTFLEAVDGRKSLPRIAVDLKLSVEAAYLTLYRFRCLGLLVYRPAPTAFVMTPRTNVRRVLPLER